MSKILSDVLKSEFFKWLAKVFGHWIARIGCAGIAAFQLVYGLWQREAPPVITWCLLFGCFCVAVFFAWRDEHRKAEQLEERMRSRIKVSCGKSVDQSVVPGSGEMWFRARLDLEGRTAVPDIEASVTGLWEDEQKVPLHEYLILTMYPGMRSLHDTNLKTLNWGRPEFVDVIHITKDSLAHFPLKFNPGSVDVFNLLNPGHTYQARVAICSSSPSHPTKVCMFEFEWTGDPDTSDLRLVSVTPP